MFNSVIRLLTKSRSHVKPLERMVNGLLITNVKMSDKITEHLSKITDLQDEVNVMQSQKKKNVNTITNLNNIIKGGM
jgi:hypothetical protein